MKTPRWKLTEQASLGTRNTMGIDARTRFLLQLTETTALPDALALPQLQNLPLLPVGAGSNLLLAGDFDGVAITFDAHNIAILEDNHNHVLMRAEAGAAWNDLVLWSLEQGLCGLENLALIPGTAGACPIQNIGAYGVEVGERIHSVEAWDTHTNRWCCLSRDECMFGYRDSIFKQQSGRWVITAVTFTLSRTPQLRLNYPDLQRELTEMGIEHPQARDVANAVINVRQRKLPDPSVLGNAGSFFKNPIISTTSAERLKAQFPELPVFNGETENTRKLSAGWLIEKAGWKGYRDGDAGVSPDHALVLVNYGQASGAQLLNLAHRIAISVEEHFGISVEPEPRIVGGNW